MPVLLMLMLIARTHHGVAFTTQTFESARGADDVRRAVALFAARTRIGASETPRPSGGATPSGTEAVALVQQETELLKEACRRFEADLLALSSSLLGQPAAAPHAAVASFEISPTLLGVAQQYARPPGTV